MPVTCVSLYSSVHCASCCSHKDAHRSTEWASCVQNRTKGSGSVPGHRRAGCVTPHLLWGVFAVVRVRLPAGVAAGVVPGLVAGLVAGLFAGVVPGLRG